ncbi:MAG: hypothetical protein V3U26_05095 [Dehalococcoidia bacterium]
MAEHLIDRLEHPCGLSVELWRHDDMPSSLLYKRLLWGEVTFQAFFLEHEANREELVAQLLEEGFVRQEPS